MDAYSYSKGFTCRGCQVAKRTIGATINRDDFESGAVCCRSFHMRKKLTRLL
ncbi:hypothetical protein [Neobacillus drentensis]|uniref:hypothetical protein n=1 Tax=Neobacillus drentensis TaxID=220684 RepID=UPI003B5891C3